MKVKTEKGLGEAQNTTSSGSETGSHWPIKAEMGIGCVRETVGKDRATPGAENRKDTPERTWREINPTPFHCCVTYTL